MAVNLLYHWNFTGDNTLSVGDTIKDIKSNKDLKSKSKR